MGRNCYELREIFALIRGVSQDVFFGIILFSFSFDYFHFPGKSSLKIRRVVYLANSQSGS